VTLGRSRVPSRVRPRRYQEKRAVRLADRDELVDLGLPPDRARAPRESDGDARRLGVRGEAHRDGEVVEEGGAGDPDRRDPKKTSRSTTFSSKNRPSTVVSGASAREIESDASFGGRLREKTGCEVSTTAPSSSAGSASGPWELTTSARARAHRAAGTDVASTRVPIFGP
jgi:hypothetical protein